MFENIYSTEHRAIVYWSHREPLKLAKEPEGQQPASRPASKAPTGSGIGESGSSQHWSDYASRSEEDEMTDRMKKVRLQKHEGQDIAEADLTPLRLQDVWNFDWHSECQRTKQPVSNLKFIVMPNIAETHTLAVLTEIAKGDLKGYWYRWPGRLWELDDNEDLIGIPLGVAVAKLIIQHHDLFGAQRTLLGGRVWWTPPAPGSPEGDAGKLSMLFMLDDAPKELIEKQRAELSKSSGSGQPQPGPSTCESSAPHKRPGSSSPEDQPSPQRQRISSQYQPTRRRV